MNKMRTKATEVSPRAKAGGAEAAEGWELRPGGMLVQKRTSDSNQNCNRVPNIKVRVKYGSSYHELILNSKASFGELKKMLARPTGLHPQNQKLIFKEQERDSRDFLDTVGVKNGSKILLVEDELSAERRRLDLQKDARMEEASKQISAIRCEVDLLAKQVASIEVEINGGSRTVETGISKLTEMLMAQLLKLDGISADGDVKLQRKMQVKRVQKYIETLDILGMRNSGLDKVKLQLQNRSYTGNKEEERKQGNFFKGRDINQSMS